MHWKKRLLKAKFAQINLSYGANLDKFDRNIGTNKAEFGRILSTYSNEFGWICRNLWSICIEKSSYKGKN